MGFDLVRKALAAALALLAPLALAAADGRWEGLIAVPGAPQRLVLDIATDAAQRWSGSVILPGRGVAGAPLRDLSVDASLVRFSLAAALPFSAAAPPVVVLRPEGADRMTGTIEFAGLTSAVEVTRRGPPQLDRPPPNRPVGRDLAGRWSGSYEIFGQPRQVTLTLDDAQAEMVIVGSRTTHVPFRRVQRGEHVLLLSDNDFGITFEGRWPTASGQIEGLFGQGPVELPLNLRRAGDGG
jgi:hypothetical protein